MITKVGGLKVEIVKTKDGRQWMVLGWHPQTDEKVAVCRAYHESNGRQWLGHTALWSRSELIVEDPQD